MKVLITGSQGQLGQCLVKAFSTHKNVILITCNKQQLDITDEQAVSAKLMGCKPDVVINTAAYTAVDNAEKESELAFSINALAPKYLAKATEKINAALIHISTDYVFDDEKSSAYTEADATNPQNVYGASKLAGEVDVVQHCTKHIILRTAWIFSEFGNNFAKTMMKLSHLEQLNIVADQIGGPTNANDIAQALVTICDGIISNKDVDWGVYHYSGEPYSSWFGFAQQIFIAAKDEGVIEQYPNLVAIPTTQYPTPAKRPKNSRLDNTKIKNAFAIQPSDWQASLINMTKFEAKS
jgi:dTDP-4-dehydrorhamnose reductase